MDIKSKSSRKDKIKGRIICLCFLFFVAVGLMLLFHSVEKRTNTKKLGDNSHYKRNFVYEILEANCGLYAKTILNKNEFLIKDSLINDEETVKTKKIDKDKLQQVINEEIESWYNSTFSSTILKYELDYYVFEKDMYNPSYFNNNKLYFLAKAGNEEREKYPFYIVLHYNHNGTLKVSYYSGIDKKMKSELIYNSEYILKGFLNEILDRYYNKEVRITSVPKISDMTFIYASENKIPYITSNEQQWIKLNNFQYGGFIPFSLLGILTAILGGFFLPFYKAAELDNTIANKIPLEVIIIGICFLFEFIIEGMPEIVYMAIKGTLWEQSVLYGVNIVNRKIIGYGINILIWTILLGIWFCFALSIRQVFTLGLKRYLKEKTISIGMLVNIKRRIKRFFNIFKTIDLTDPSDKFLVRISTINFIILAVLCCFWIFGIFVLILYSLLLFSILRKRTREIKNKYQILLQTTSKMAEGNLEMLTEEDLGLFEPLKEELTKIQIGFKKAVEEEVKSQNMKTELITNVSHDLKTPLTAIITYINLLKEENIGEEEKKSYIEVLDKKSQRLKKLIEDLFEISKVNSNNITLNLMQIDLVALIKEVEIELEEKIKDSNIEFRSYFSKEKIILNLDSEKTYRIFENLIMNITKYAMPYSRAYIQVEELKDKVIVTLKNVSQAELNLTPEELTERFVRGDRARNTEGTGLGLAIVKSFVQLQQGTFEIVIDGDLFKAIIQWEKNS